MFLSLVCAGVVLDCSASHSPLCRNTSHAGRTSAEVTCDGSRCQQFLASGCVPQGTHARTCDGRRICVRRAASRFARVEAYLMCRWSRHPSYTGFFYWGLGMQLTLQNPVSFAIFMVVLWRFFNARIKCTSCVSLTASPLTCCCRRGARSRQVLWKRLCRVPEARWHADSLYRLVLIACSLNSLVMNAFNVSLARWS